MTSILLPGELLLPGEYVGGHEILHHLGSGERVEVYAALGPTGEPCTLEIVNVGEGRTASVAARLVEQGKAIARIAHPAVVQPDGVGAWEDVVWRSSALIEGETVRQRLAAGRPPLDVALAWMLQACEAVAAAHRGGVIHGGLTPDSLIVSADDTVKVIGFGLVALRGCGVESTDEQYLLAALHQPLEQSLGMPIAEGWDVYAMGLIGYEILTGIHPMGNEARPKADVFTWHVTGKPEPLLAHAPETPPVLAALIHHAMEKDVEKGRPTVRALADGARDALDGLRSPAAVTRPMAVCEVPASALPAEVLPAEVPASDLPAQVSAPDEGARSAAVEQAERRTSVAPRRARRVGLAVGAVTLVAAATGWMLFGRVAGSGASEVSPVAPGVSPVPPAASASVPPPSPASAKPERGPAKAAPRPPLQPRAVRR
jgi:serine/threonine-protein kinase